MVPIFSLKMGRVDQIKEVNIDELVFIVTRYKPETGDIVIGRVIEVRQNHLVVTPLSECSNT